MEETMTTATETIVPESKKNLFNPINVFWFIGVIGFLIGSYGVYLRFAHELRFTNLGSYIPWGLWVATYEYFVWLEVGSLLIFTLLVYVFKWNKVLPKLARQLYLTALVILAMSLILIGLDLGHPFRFWHVLASPQWGSLMTWMIWLHVIYMIVLLAKLVIEVYGHSDGAKNIGKWLSYLSMPLGVALIVVAGSVFGVAMSRPLWQGSALPIYFLLSALVVGTGLLAFQFVWFWTGERDEEYVTTAQRLGKLLFGLLLIGLVAAALGGIVVLYPGVPAQAEALRLTLFGPFWWIYWVLHIGLGVILPIVILLTQTRTAKRIGVAAGLLILTFVAVPLNIVIPSQLVVGLLEGSLVNAFTGPGLAASYFPSTSEWLVTVFALSFGLLVFLAGYHFLGLHPQPMGNAASTNSEELIQEQEG
jgi:protein NrfD